MSTVVIRVTFHNQRVCSQHVSREPSVLSLCLKTLAVMDDTAAFYVMDGESRTVRGHVDHIMKNPSLTCFSVDRRVAPAAPPTETPGSRMARRSQAFMRVRIYIDHEIRERLVCSFDQQDALRQIEKYTRAGRTLDFDYVAWQSARPDGARRVTHTGPLADSIALFLADYADAHAPDLGCYWTTPAARRAGLRLIVDGVPHIVEACAPDTDAIMRRLQPFMDRGAVPTSVGWGADDCSDVTDLSPLWTILQEYSRVQRALPPGDASKPLRVVMLTPSAADAWFQVEEADEADTRDETDTEADEADTEDEIESAMEDALRALGVVVE